MTCPKHPNYKGLRLGKRNALCDGCVAFYNKNKAEGLREVRRIKKKESVNLLDQAIGEILDDEK